MRNRPMLVGFGLGVLLVASAIALAVPSMAGTATKTKRISLSSTGAQGDGDSRAASISADGRFVAFESSATNLVGNDTNGKEDVFVRDRRTGKTRRFSVSSAGAQGDGDSRAPSISANGRFVAFRSAATNLVGGDTNASLDVFVGDRRTGKTKRVSVSSAGVQGNSFSESPSISADGRFVAFESAATNLVGNDSNGFRDVFVRDRRGGRTKRVSVSSAGAEGNNESRQASISADGRFVAFRSDATNLVGNDTNGFRDVFVHNLERGKTKRVSVSSAGAQGKGDSSAPSPMSADGRFVAFDSAATNLVGGDTNGFSDVFVRDRRTGKTRRFSVSSTGAQGNGDSFAPSISADGRFLAFESSASTLVGGDNNGALDVFVRGPLR